MTDLPEGWEETSIKDLFAFKYGKGLTQEKRKASGGKPVYGSNGIVGEHDQAITKGPTIIVGRKGSVGEVHFSPVKCWPIDTTYFIDEFPDGSPPEYWALYLRSLGLGQQEKSSAIPGISRQDIYKLKVAVPPVDEQRRIIAKLEELLGKVDACQNRLAKIPVLLKRFRQSVLAAACSGHLTADWREDNSQNGAAQLLLAEIDKRRRQIWIKQRRAKQVGITPGDYPTPIAAMSEFELDLPGSWAIASMDQLTCVITSGSRDWKRYYRTNGPGTFIMAQNLRPLWFDPSIRLAVDPPKNNRDRARSEVRRNDILVTIVGANTGDVCRIPFDAKEHYVCQSVALMRPVMGETAAFLELFLNSDAHGLRQYRSWIYGEGRPHLSFDHLRQTAVGVPPLTEQREIVRRVDVLFKFADQIEHRFKSAKAQIDKLTQSILAKAFRGELVPTEAELASRGRLALELRRARSDAV